MISSFCYSGCQVLVIFYHYLSLFVDEGSCLL